MDQSSNHSPRFEPSLEVDLEPAEIIDEMADDPVVFEGDRSDVAPDVDVVFAPDVMERSDIAIVLRPDAFPAEAAVLIAVAEEEGATPEVLERLRQLPSGLYETMGEVWQALGGAHEHRGVEPEPTAPELEVEIVDDEDLAELQAVVEAQLAGIEDADDVLDVEPPAAPTPPPTPAPAHSPLAPSPLAPVVHVATLPLRVTAGVLRVTASLLDKVADAVPGAPRH